MAREISKAGAKAAGMAKGVSKAVQGQTGILRHLAQEHGEVAALMKRVSSSSPTSNVRQELFPEIKRNLLAHAKAEEKAFYPTLRPHPTLEALVDRSLQQHRAIEQMIGDLSASDVSTATWMTKFERLVTAVQEHVDLEEQTIFPKVQDVFDDDQRDDMLDRYEEEEQAQKERLA